MEAFGERVEERHTGISFSTSRNRVLCLQSLRSMGAPDNGKRSQPTESLRCKAFLARRGALERTEGNAN